MPAKKTASKGRKKAATARKKATSRKPAARSKAAASKRKTAKKKASTRKVTRKKAVTRKKPVSRKKVTRKKATKKKVTRKKVTKKKVTKKKVAKKQVSKRKVAKKKVSTKWVAKNKAASRKKAVRKPAARNAAAHRNRKKAPARKRGDILSGPIHGIDPYKPDRGEEYMSPDQLEHFEAILLSWKRELMKEVDRTVHHMQDEAANFPDPSDRATQESEFGLELRTRDRERKLLRKINSAIMRIDEGSYGFCEETGEEIGLKRLEARPVATMCLEAQERREMAERQYRDRDDRYR